jgi:phosphoadenosine phosphosulfate reductase
LLEWIILLYLAIIMDNESKSIQFIRKVAEGYTELLYAGNSGGKDSAVLDFLLQKSEIRYQSIYMNTTIDPPGTIGHIRKYYPHTKILQPKLSFYKLVEKKSLPTRINRYCCQYLKEYAGIGVSTFEGIRSAESLNRQGRDYIQCDSRKSMKGAKHIYPLYDWTDKDIWDFIEKNDIKLAPAYSNGLKRLGCVGCPQVTRKGQRAHEFDLYPRYYQAIKNAIQKGMINNPQWKITELSGCDGEKAMQWWLSGKSMNDYFKDRIIFRRIVPFIRIKSIPISH